MEAGEVNHLDDANTSNHHNDRMENLKECFSTSVEGKGDIRKNKGKDNNEPDEPKFLSCIGKNGPIQDSDVSETSVPKRERT